ncbi:MAG: endonuclease III [Chloroflexi bacterium]|nr:endonuclease III [Chloroflexota bacterium]
MPDVLDLLSSEYGPVKWTPRYDPLSELIFTILSQHTSDINSGRAFDNLLRTFGSLENVAVASVEEIEDAVRMAGLAKSKAPRIKDTLERVHRQTDSYDLSFLGEMPMEEAKAWLKSIPGVGPKTAAIVLCFSFGMPAMPVDTHIYRVSKRLGFIGPKISADQAHDILEEMVPDENVFSFHVYLINHGRRVCKALRPLCKQCVLAWGCPSRGLFSTTKANKATKIGARKRPAAK